jgi:putative tricarboxylic transport membrane protein
MCRSKRAAPISNALLLGLNLPLIGVSVRLLAVPKPILFGAVLAFSMLGVYTVNHNSLDLVVVWVLGVLSFFMRRYNFPIAPAILGLVLGPLLEQEFRKAMAISASNPTVFFTRPVSAVILAAAALLLLRTLKPSKSHQ